MNELCIATVVNPRFKSQVFDENDVWGMRWWSAMVKTAEADAVDYCQRNAFYCQMSPQKFQIFNSALYLQRRHVRRRRLRHRLPPSAVPAIFANLKLYAS